MIRPTRRRSLLAPGAPAPGFTLETAHGVAVSMHELLLDGPLVLEFVRGTWDPNSRDRLRALADARASLEAEGARCLVVTCESADAVARTLERHPSPLSIVVDETRVVARAYGVHRFFSYGAFRVARAATFLVDRCGFVRSAHRGRSPIDAQPIAQVLDRLAALRAPGGNPSRVTPATD